MSCAVIALKAWRNFPMWMPNTSISPDIASEERDPARRPGLSALPCRGLVSRRSRCEDLVEISARTHRLRSRKPAGVSNAFAGRVRDQLSLSGAPLLRQIRADLFQPQPADQRTREKERAGCGGNPCSRRPLHRRSRRDSAEHPVFSVAIAPGLSTGAAQDCLQDTRTCRRIQSRAGILTKQAALRYAHRNLSPW
ncbi:MAG: hypothetical protein JWL77_6711 [Chthonomonadaceae bacterium]|nr:hypothetical protein [Chthonomonadaceae bacterium]